MNKRVEETILTADAGTTLGNLDATKVGATIEDIAQARDVFSSLKQAGAERFDPVRFRFIESLFLRIEDQQETVVALIAIKMLKSLSEYQQDFSGAHQEAVDYLAQISNTHPDVAAKAQDFFNCCNFKAVKKLYEQLNKNLRREQNPLVELTEQLNRGEAISEDDRINPSFEEQLRQQESDVLASILATDTEASDDKSASKQLAPNRTASGELKSVRLFRESWVKLSAEQLVTRMIKEGPKDAGPLNPQSLVIRSLSAMRDLSPEYLSRFVSYIDTMLWLELAGDKIETSKPKKKRGKAKSKKG